MVKLRSDNVLISKLVKKFVINLQNLSIILNVHYFNDDQKNREEESMNLTPKQRTVLLTLTTEWITPKQIAGKLPEEWGNISSVNQTLKDLMLIGLVQVNPVMFGLYRLTTEGMNIKELEL